MSDDKLGPFATGTNPITGQATGATDAHSRHQLVLGFDYQQCLRALQVEGLQKSVETAIRRRMR